MAGRIAHSIGVHRSRPVSVAVADARALVNMTARTSSGVDGTGFGAESVGRLPVEPGPQQPGPDVVSDHPWVRAEQGVKAGSPA